MTDTISSAKNPTVKHIKKLLSSGSYRRKSNLAIGEGAHIAESFLKSGGIPALAVYAEMALKNPELQQIADRLNRESVDSLVLKDSLFESLSDIHASDGILILFELSLPSLVKPLEGDSLLLESVQDPGNLGTILRTAAAAGVRDVYMSPKTASSWSPKALRSGMGAQFSLRVHESVDLSELISSSSVPVIATDLGSNLSIYEADLTRPAAWLFGNEGSGVSAQLLSICQETVIIPQSENSVESLNVAASVAVCLFEQRRQQNL